MIARFALCLVMACALCGCTTETENTLPPDPNAEPKVTTPPRRNVTKPPPTPRGSGVPIK